METHNDQVIVEPCVSNDTQAVDGDGRIVFEESQATKKSLGVADICPEQKGTYLWLFLMYLCIRV